ncbi:MAG: Crp/Fnr family transcriptional regulator [Oscillospiraceae bacterium]|nr:Crp/Fnr family transcriptional regulator [Oscillospiraceae bacterium]
MDGTIFSAAEQRRLQMAGAQQHFGKGRILYLQGQQPQALYYLCAGKVKSYILSDDGTERILAIYSPGSIFGEAAFFDGLPRMSSASAQADCRVVTLGREQVAALFREDSTLALRMLEYVSRTVRALSEQVNHVTFFSAEQRIAQLLDAMAAGDVVSASQDDLAGAAGVSRVTVCRCLGSLAAQGLIQTGYRSVHICSRSALRDYIKKNIAAE